jgi:uncharacterized membrane protein
MSDMMLSSILRTHNSGGPVTLTVPWQFLCSAYALIHISVHKGEKTEIIMLKILGIIFSCPASLSLTNTRMHTHARAHAHTHTHTHTQNQEWMGNSNIPHCLQNHITHPSHNFKGRLHTQSTNFLNRPYMQYQTSTIGPFSCICKMSITSCTGP